MVEDQELSGLEVDFTILILSTEDTLAAHEARFAFLHAGFRPFPRSPVQRLSGTPA